MTRFTQLLLIALVLHAIGSWMVNGGTAESVNGIRDMKQAAQIAVHQKKPLLVNLSTQWCGYCKKMQHDPFANEHIAEHINRCFVPVALDGERDSTAALQLDVDTYPTMALVSPSMKVVKKLIGYRTPQQFDHEIAELCNHDSHKKETRQYAAQGTEKPIRYSVFAEICPVTLANEGRRVFGLAATESEFRSYQVRFRTEGDKRRFQKAPERYRPVADGYCIVSWLDESKRQSGRLKYGVRYRGAIWLFATSEHRDRFAQHPEQYFKRLFGPMPVSPSASK